MESFVGELYAQLSSALSPFNPGVLIVYCREEYPDWNLLLFTIRCSSFSDNCCYVNVRRSVIVDTSPEFVLSNLVSTAVQYFRSIPALPVDDHIVLGEN